MKFCPECGNSVVGCKFCPNCGYSINASLKTTPQKVATPSSRPSTVRSKRTDKV